MKRFSFSGYENITNTLLKNELNVNHRAKKSGTNMGETALELAIDKGIFEIGRIK